MKNFKKLALSIGVIALVISLAFVINAFAGESNSYLWGDANGDGLIDTGDAIAMRQYFANYDYENSSSSIELSKGADIDKDGSITLSDLVLLRRGLVDDSFAPEEECDHQIVSSTYNEVTGYYDQTCSKCNNSITSPINLVLTPERIKSYIMTSQALAVDKQNAQVIEENGREFLRLTTNKSGAIYFYPFHGTNNTIVTGEYAVFKYRLNDGSTTAVKWGAYSSTIKTSAGSGEQSVQGYRPEVVDDGQWHIAIIKLNPTQAPAWFAPNAEGDYLVNFVRLDLTGVSLDATIDIEYFGFCENPLDILNLTADEDFGNDVLCSHYNIIEYKDSLYHSNSCVICGEGEDIMHSLEGNVEFDEESECYKGKCSICGSDEATSTFNHYVNADMVKSYATSPIVSGYGIANMKSAQYFAATDEDIAFARLTPKKARDWLYFYYYIDMSAQKVTGQYVVMKFRLPTTEYTGNTIACYVGSATSPNSTAASGESFTIIEAQGTDGWVIAAYDMSKVAHYGANADGTYSAKYLRFDAYIDQYIDVAFIGVCDNLSAVGKNIGEATTCTHSIYNYDITLNTHAKIDCAICGIAATDTSAVAHRWSAPTYNERLGGYVMSCNDCRKQVFMSGNSELNCFFDPVTIQKAETKTEPTLHYAGSELQTDEDGSLYIRFTGGNNNTPYFSLVSKTVNAGTTTNAGHFLIFKYRYTVANSATIANLYVSSAESPGAKSGNKVPIAVIADGNWHVAIVDLQNTGTAEAFEGDTVTLLRLDLFGWNTPAANHSVDVAYFAISDNIDELRAFDDDYDTYGLVGSAELKSVTKAIATEKVDEEHNGMSYVTLTGNGEKNYTQITKSDNIFMGTGKYVAMLYRKDSSTSFVSQCRMYFNKNNATDKYYYAPYISDGKWHLTIFDMSGDDFFCDGMAKTVRFDWFNFTSQTISVDVAYVKFFNTLDEAYAFYGEYVDEYLGEDSCDHLVKEWKYGVDDDPNTDTFKEYSVCSHCGMQTDDARDVEFSVALDKVTDSLGTYPSDYLSTIGTSENSILIFNAENYSAIYPANGITVAVGDDLSIAGSIQTAGDIDSIWYKVIDSNGETVSTWKQCRCSFDGAEFAAYADLDGISGTGLTVVFAVVPAGLPEDFTDRYLPVVRVENVSAGADVEKKANFTASNDLGVLMDNVFDGNYVMNETVMFLDYGDSKTLLYDITRIISVKSYDGNTTYVEGVDYELVDGKIVILEGSSIPCITPDRYYNVESTYLKTYYNGVETTVHNGEGNATTQWQVNIEYEHSGEWNGYVQDNQSNYFANLIEKLMNGENVTIIFYGDSITAGANSSFMHNYAQQQYSYSLLLTNAIADAFGYTVHYVNTQGMAANMGKVPTSDYVAGTRGTITYINTAVGGWKSADGLNNFDAHVKAYVEQYGCDLFVCAYGMNNLGTPYNTFIGEIKEIVDQVYALAPDTSVMLISTMFRNNTETVAETYMAAAKGQDERLMALAEDYRNEGYECGITHMTLMSESILTRKDFMDYTGNNINHPNDFFGRIYAQTVFEALIGYDNLVD